MNSLDELIAAADAVVSEALVTDDADATARMHRLRVAVMAARYQSLHDDHDLSVQLHEQCKEAFKRDTRITELEAECDLLIWENEQAAKAMLRVEPEPMGVSFQDLTDEQRAQLLRQLDGVASQQQVILSVGGDDITADLRKRLTQAMEALHAERKARRAADFELGRLRGIHHWLHCALNNVLLALTTRAVPAPSEEVP